MNTALVVAAGLLLVVIAIALHYRYWVGRLTVDLDYELHKKLPTRDGAQVELRRIKRGEGADDGPPILVVHGIALNHRNNDFTEELSLGRYLSAAGRDVWLLTLRSGRDDLSFREERSATFDSMVQHDLPLGVEEVLRLTGAPRVDYVGFSMGGMLMYGAAGRTIPNEQLRRVVIIGSPGRVLPPHALLAKLNPLIPLWLVPTLRLRVISRLVAFFADVVSTPIHHLVMNPRNVDRGLAGVAMVNGFVNIPRALAAGFVRFSQDGGVISVDGQPALPGLATATAPALFIAGAVDHLAPPETVRLAYEAWGAAVGTPTQWRLVGVDDGAAADYGHGDLAIGRFADQDVYEPVRAFLAAA